MLCRVAARRSLAVLVAGALFMEFLDGTIIATAAPDMAESLGVRPADIGVTITAYLLTVAVGTPASGWIAERFGTRRVFVLAIMVFTLASLACAAAPSLEILIAARILQGAGGALMVPVGRLVVLRATAPREIIQAVALLTWPALIAPVIAPLLGGLLTTYLSWHWIFLINVPLGVVAAVVALRIVPELRAPASPGLDWTGFVLTAIAVAAVVIGGEALAAAPPHLWLCVAATALAVLTSWAAVRHLARAANPLLDLRVMTIPTFRLAHVSGSVYRATTFAVPFVLPLMMQVGFGWSAVAAGAYAMAIFAGNLAIKPTTTPMLRRFPARTVISVAILILSATMFGCALITPDTPPAVIIVLLVISGAARSVGFTGYGTLGLADVDQPQMRDANTVSVTLQQLAGGLGVTLGVLLLAGSALVPGLDSPGEIGVYRLTFAALGLLTLACVVPAWRIGPQAGHRLH